VGGFSVLVVAVVFCVPAVVAPLDFSVGACFGTNVVWGVGDASVFFRRIGLDVPFCYFFVRERVSRSE